MMGFSEDSDDFCQTKGMNVQLLSLNFKRWPFMFVFLFSMYLLANCIILL